jgi:hypothetical protein
MRLSHKTLRNLGSLKADSEINRVPAAHPVISITQEMAKMFPKIAEKTILLLPTHISRQLVVVARKNRHP